MKYLMSRSIRKVWRYIFIFGIARTLIKVIARSKIKIRLEKIFRLNPMRRSGKRIFFIGCGHHAFSTLAFFVFAHTKSKLVGVYDPNFNASNFLGFCYGARYICESFDELKSHMAEGDVVYIASNHASHESYTRQLLDLNLILFVEKPLCLDSTSVGRLCDTIIKRDISYYAGYNRPLAPAIKKISAYLKSEQPLTFSAAVIGHSLSADHWYKTEGEGSRITSNLGHWLDLFYHLLLAKGTRISELDVTVRSSDSVQTTDNLALILRSNLGDLATITFSCRAEPFEGVSELITVQNDDLIAKIYDFRRLDLWFGSKFQTIRYKNKTCGHKEAALQPFESVDRPIFELFESTKILLKIEQEFRNGNFDFSIKI